MMKHEYPMIPAGSGPMCLLAILCLSMLALVGLFAYIAWSSRNVKFEVSAEGLRIHGIYGRMIPMDDLRPAEARAIDLRQEKQLAPTRRTNGAGLPGFQAGWFKLRSGEKALLFVTDRSRVAYVPTRSGYAIMLSTPEPQALIAALQAMPQSTDSDN